MNQRDECLGSSLAPSNPITALVLLEGLPLSARAIKALSTCIMACSLEIGFIPLDRVCSSVLQIWDDYVMCLYFLVKHVQ